MSNPYRNRQHGGDSWVVPLSPSAIKLLAEISALVDSLLTLELEDPPLTKETCELVELHRVW